MLRLSISLATMLALSILAMSQRLQEHDPQIHGMVPGGHGRHMQNGGPHPVTCSSAVKLCVVDLFERRCTTTSVEREPPQPMVSRP